MKNRAFTFIEILAAIPLIAVITLISAQLYVLLLSDLPKTYKAEETYNHLTLIVGSIQEDFEMAESFSVTPGTLEINTSTDETVQYLVGDGKIVRLGTDDDTKWDIPFGLLEFSARSSNSIRIASAVEYMISGEKRKPFANKHIIFSTRPECREVSYEKQ